MNALESKTLLEIAAEKTNPAKWVAMMLIRGGNPQMTCGEAMDMIEATVNKAINTATAKIIEERDELQTALCVARQNALTQHKLGIRKFAALCGASPTWVSKWTAKDSGGMTDIICRR